MVQARKSRSRFDLLQHVRAYGRRQCLAGLLSSLLPSFQKEGR
nr:MAG TPA: hypothetical protein [Caudoviricetes sp.]DAZ37870.1 MAG TPA: hypothetical protein [Caudoviricetes sp.]